MKRVRYAIPVVILLWAGIASANSIPTFTITQAIIVVSPNQGAGNNVGFIFTGAGGFSLSGFGGTSGYGDVGDIVSAGDPIGIASISWTALALTIANTTYDPDTVDLSAIDIIPLGALSVPGGIVPATLSQSFSNAPIQMSAGAGEQFILFNLKIPPGTLTINYVPIAGNPSLFQFSNASFNAVSTVPEPGTLAFMATGLAGIVGAAQRRRRCSHGTT